MTAKADPMIAMYREQRDALRTELEVAKKRTEDWGLSCSKHGEQEWAYCHMCQEEEMHELEAVRAEAQHYNELATTYFVRGDEAFTALTAAEARLTEMRKALIAYSEETAWCHFCDDINGHHAPACLLATAEGAKG